MRGVANIDHSESCVFAVGTGGGGLVAVGEPARADEVGVFERAAHVVVEHGGLVFAVGNLTRSFPEVPIVGAREAELAHDYRLVLDFVEVLYGVAVEVKAYDIAVFFGGSERVFVAPCEARAEVERVGGYFFQFLPANFVVFFVEDGVEVVDVLFAFFGRGNEFALGKEWRPSRRILRSRRR